MCAMIERTVSTEETTREKARVFTSRTVSPNGRGRQKKVEAEPGPPKTIIREYFESAVVTVIIALFGMTFIVQAVKVPTASTHNTITVGDHLFVTKFILAPCHRLPFLPH